MKIGILTHPQHSNYGGILQCYALSEYLKKLGHEPVVIRREPNKSIFLKRWILILLKGFRIPRYYRPNRIDRTVNIRSFVEQNLNRTHPIYSDKHMSRICKEYNLDVVIVGSDQVWRRSFAKEYGYNYFLDFVPDNVVKLSYAASFGICDWQYTLEESEKICSLIQRFKSVSVREEEAVSLCNSKMHVDAEWVIDPTLLLTLQDYSLIMSDRKINEKYVFVYWLGDKSLIKDEVEKYNIRGYKIVELNLREECEQVSVQDWLSYIKYADRIITDSFHGVVFSILFEKRFSIYKNESGGVGRLFSLMKLLGLSYSIDIDQELDYAVLSEKLESLREKSRIYLTRSLIRC